MTRDYSTHDTRESRRVAPRALRSRRIVHVAPHSDRSRPYGNLSTLRERPAGSRDRQVAVRGARRRSRDVALGLGSSPARLGGSGWDHTPEAATPRN